MYTNYFILCFYLVSFSALIGFEVLLIYALKFIINLYVLNDCHKSGHVKRY